MSSTASAGPLIASGLIICLTGLAELLVSRKIGLKPKRSGLKIIAWLMLIAALLQLGLGISWSVGISLWLGLCAIAGFFVTLFVALVRQKHPPAPLQRPARTTRKQPQSTAISPAVGIAAVVGGTILALIMMLSLTLVLPLPAADRALLSVVLWPLLWAVIILYLGATTQPWIALGKITGMSLILSFAGGYLWIN